MLKTPPPALSLSDVFLSFDKPVLRGVTFDIQKGEMFSIIGPSGEGKTVLLKMLAGLIPPKSGTIRFDGADLYRLNRKTRALFARRMGMAFQKGGLFDSMNTAQNLHFPLREMLRLKDPERTQRVRQALLDVGLSKEEEVSVKDLSGGMQKRLGIARALILSPEVALYDDPTAGLDPITARAINDLIRCMKEKYRMTVVIVSSDPRQIYADSDRIGFLCRGDFLLVGTPDEIRGSTNQVVRQFIEGNLEGPLTTEREVT